MLSKSQVKYIHSLKLKKFREIHKQFIAEGDKLVKDLVNSLYHIDSIYAAKEWIMENRELIASGKIRITEIMSSELERITALSTASPVLAVVDIPGNDVTNISLSKGLTLLIDDIKDPGNLGTIIRIADWFGISRVICSEDTVDLYNPKTIQATMGSVARVKVSYTDLVRLLKQTAPGAKIYGTFLEGENIYEKDLDPAGMIIIGNESKGISSQVAHFVTDRLFIPAFRSGENHESHAESLNASIAAAIVCSEFRRRTG
jgi:RNA methyltransferase, TrmH family